MKRITKVEIGQRFRSLGVSGQVTGFYEVQALFRSSIDHLDYARIVDVGDRHRTKVFSVDALVSPHHFMPVPSREYRPN